MRYLALAADYDGTLAYLGRMSPEVVAALERLAATRRKLLLVTGRQQPELCAIVDRLDLFDRVVAENGGVIYRPKTKDVVVLCEPPPAELVARLRDRGVDPLAVGETIVATRRLHENVVREVIDALGLPLRVVFNKDSVMVLRRGVSKATGLLVALGELDLSPESVVAIGDAENDASFLRLCRCAVAVADAVPSIKRGADIVTARGNGQGVIELVDAILADDLRSIGVEKRPVRRS